MEIRSYISCCYQCEERYIGCHAKCERYQKAREELDKLNKEIKETKKKQNTYIPGPNKRGADKFKKTKERQR